jgi:hypothetical protein
LAATTALPHRPAARAAAAAQQHRRPKPQHGVLRLHASERLSSS